MMGKDFLICIFTQSESSTLTVCDDTHITDVRRLVHEHTNLIFRLQARVAQQGRLKTDFILPTTKLLMDVKSCEHEEKREKKRKQDVHHNV